MAKVAKSFDLITQEKRQAVIREIIGYFASERDEQIGVIAAEGVLDFMLETLAPALYNKGVEDALDFIRERMENLGPDMEALLKK